jgi:hypothetical protein
MDPATLRTRYERLADFAALRHEQDPTGKFTNEMLDQYLDPARG